MRAKFHEACKETGSADEAALLFSAQILTSQQLHTFSRAANVKNRISRRKKFTIRIRINGMNLIAAVAECT